VFDTREAAIEYIQSQIRFTEEGLAKNDPSYGYSLFAEPTILRYVNEEDETNPHVILVIGSVTNDGTQYSDNRFCIIDIDKTEQEIADLEEEIAAAVKSLTLITKDTDTLKLYAEKTEEGTYVSGDVKVAESHIFDDVREYNNIMVTPEGLFLYVNLTYDEETEIFTFTVNNADGTLSETSVKLPNNYVTRGYYSVQDQSIHLTMRESDEVVIDCKYLIAEWDVEGDEAKSPIYLTREEVDFDVDDNSRLKPWQDVLRAEVRIKDESFDPVTGKPVYDPDSVNILRRTQDRKYLFVDGKASNIVYYMDGQKSNVKEALDKLGKIKLSSDYSNILQEKTDGFFASAKLNYISKENTLVFKVSNQEETRIKLNSFRLFENVYYDSTKEALIITYIDGNDELQIVEIPIGQMLTEWVVYNEGHTVQLDKSRSVEGKDVLTADVKIFQGHNNILTETNHTMYVRGEADNIKYLPTGTTTVKDVLDELKAEDARIDSKLDEEIARATAEEQRIDTKLDQEIADRIADVDEEQARAEAAEKVLTDKIGTGFTDDPHDNVTYKFEQLQDQVNSEAEKLQNEIDRSEAKDTEHDGRLDAIDAEIGEGFGPRNTVRDEIDREKAEREAADAELQSEIDAVSADSSSRLSDVINEDESIDVETRNDAAGKPTIKVVKVNLSTEVEDDRKNIIKLNSDGLFANVDLAYEKTANKLIFHTSNGEPDKEIQLEGMSSIISIEYNPNKEAIVITYMTNGHEIKTVEIPVGDLIREWKPSESTDGAIKLTLAVAPSGTTDKDILYGEVLISDHEDNILVNDGGKLYVSNSDIEANTAAIEALDGRMDTAEADINALEEGLREEVSARTLSDEALDRKIVAETNRATQREDAIAETARRIGEKLETEIGRATSAETALDEKIDAEITRSTDKDQELTDAIHNEADRAMNAEHALQDDVDTVTEAARRIGEKLEVEIGRATSAETALDEKIDAEITRSTQKDQELTDALTTENTRAVSAETALQTALEKEITSARTEEARIEARLDDEIANRVQDVADEESRATSVENILRGDLNREVDRATAREGELNEAITEESLRAQNADNELYRNIADVSASSIAADAQLEIKLTNESSARTLADSVLDDKIEDEIARSTAKDTELANTLQQEITDREQGDAELADEIRANKLTFDDTTSIDFNDPYEENNKVRAAVKLQEGDNMIKLGQGLYATAHLSYDTGTNKIKLTTSAGEEEYQLAGATVIDNLEYDSTNKELVITYHDGNGGVHTVRFGVSELFNEWGVQNPSENSAIELTKTPAATPGAEDKLSGRILLTNLEDNAVKIINNGLYVSSSAMTGAEEIAKCAKNELKVLEKAVIGHHIGEECGSGYTYEPNPQGAFISSANSFANADYILDQNIERVEEKVDDAVEDIDCINNKADKLFELLYGATAPVMPNCGSGVTYQPYVDACIISGATSFMEADQMLNDQLCQLLTMWVSGLTCTNESQWVEDGANRKIQIYTRLSRGKYSEMSDEDIFIEKLESPLEYIDPTNSEFTDTNVLRIACINEGPSGTTPSVESMQNGIYLSNEWDCGLYYGPSDTEAKEKAEAAGYKTANYSTDETQGASGYNYMNNMRITPPQP
jgi:hypothetical protein